MEIFGRQPGTPFRTHVAKRLSLCPPLRLPSEPENLFFIAWQFITVAFCVALLALPLAAQSGRPTAPSTGGVPSDPSADPYSAANGPMSTDPSMFYGAGASDPFMAMGAPIETAPVILPEDTSRLFRAESCENWTEAAVESPTVSVVRLSVPGKASGEFQKACGAYKDKRLDEAENRARKAIKLYPDYGPAWVLLGQILTAESKDAAGRAACNQAKSVDPRYSPSYVCLADFAARANDWKQVSTLSGYALSLDPASNMYAYMYAAEADLHLKNIDEAETDAQSAEKLDRWHKAPELHLLLAQIYQAKGDRPKEISELRQYLKFHPHAPEASAAKATLAQVEAPPAR